jgi:hypothetical protein
MKRPFSVLEAKHLGVWQPPLSDFGDPIFRPLVSSYYHGLEAISSVAMPVDQISPFESTIFEPPKLRTLGPC